MKNKLIAIQISGTPLVAIASRDQFVAISVITEVFNGFPVVQFDCASGFKAVNNKGQQVLSTILGENDPAVFTDPVTCLTALRDRAPEGTIAILIGADRYLGAERDKVDARANQAVANCRNDFKATNRKIFMLSPTRLMLPGDLQSDVFYIEEPSPDAEARGEIIDQTYIAAKESSKSLPTMKAPLLQECVAATRGLSAFAVEQAFSLSLTKEELNIKELWRQWRESINATPGLTVDVSGASLDKDVGGLENFKNFSKAIMGGKNPPTAIVRVEEIEKVISGAGTTTGVGDSSGTTQEILQLLLTFMQEENATGLIALGPAGSGKSLASVAMGSVSRIPTINLDLTAVKGSLVGESGQKMRQALATIKALAGSRTFWIGTCNGVAALPPELRRRFQYGIWFFDLPDATEREAIWKIWLKKYPDVKDVRPNDEGWTGAEIRTAVQTADELRCTPAEAAKWIVPVSKMGAEVVENLRRNASNRYLSAHKPGPYVYEYNSQSLPTSAARKFGSSMN